MKLIFNKVYKSITNRQEYDLPNFVVLTGKNGSGKSHLMEAMAREDVCVVRGDDGENLSRIKFIPFSGLNPHVDERCDYMALMNNRKQIWKGIEQHISKFYSMKERHDWTLQTFLGAYPDSKKVLDHWLELVGGDIDSITEDLVYDNYEITSEELFSSQFASVFKLYHIRLVENQFNQFLNATKGEHYKVYSDEEFEKIYGPKPWDLINRMLSRAGLTYVVNHPEGNAKELDFHLHLTDVNTGVKIQVNDLSTGEKVLMSLALSIYNTKEETARPDVLLLDEPDAALHPEFSKVLINSIENSIVKEAGVRVIVSTHSPLTVALSPESSIFLMDKALCRPVKLTKQKAIGILTGDLDNIRLSLENRRQVFVESQYDVQYYTRIVPLLDQSLPTVPQFLPPRSSNGSNCDELRDIVNELRKLGNDLVYGITDFDNKNHSSDVVFVLGEGNRYAIDNYVFDPIYVAFLLVLKRILNTETVGLPSLSYVQLGSLDDKGIQQLIDYVIASLGLSSTNVVEYKVQSGRVFRATQEYFLMKGHDLEKLIKDTWKPLYHESSGGDNVLKNYVLSNVWRDYPGFISTDFANLFMKIR